MCRNEIYSNPLCSRFMESCTDVEYLFPLIDGVFILTGRVLQTTGKKHKKMRQISLGSGAKKVAHTQSDFTLLLSFWGDLLRFVNLQLWLISNQGSSLHSSTLHPTRFCDCFDWESPRSKNYVPRTFTDEQHIDSLSWGHGWDLEM